ncbi:MAG: uroporphyrinogen-III C-methyltransferase [Nitrososphaerales archaeon]
MIPGSDVEMAESEKGTGSGKGRGRVYIVGAGPGDAGLLTLKAFDLITNAEVVLYDRLVSDEILKMIPDSVKKVFVGRSVGDDYAHQDETNKLMLQHARDGRKVVRLKGGDPFIFGRGGEEAEFLRENGVEFEIVPGISSATGSPAYAGIPLTHRLFSSSVAIVTGHEDPKKGEPAVRWRELATSTDTIVVLMGMGRLKRIVDDLAGAGLAKDTDVAIIENGTTREQKVLLGKLENIVERAKGSDLKPPVVIVIGRVAGLAQKLDWLGVVKKDA